MIPDSALYSVLALRGKDGDIARVIRKVSNLIKIKPKHANTKANFLSREIKSTTKYLQFC